MRNKTLTNKPYDSLQPTAHGVSRIEREEIAIFQWRVNQFLNLLSAPHDAIFLRLLALAPFRYQQILTGVGYGGAITSPRDNRERIYARIAQQELRLLLRTCHKVFFLRTEDAPMPASIDHSFFYFPWFF